MTACVACHGARLVDVVCQVDVDHFQTKRIKFSNNDADPNRLFSSVKLLE